MSTTLTPRAVVESYFKAWSEKRTDEAHALLADNLVFTGPNAHITSRQDFKKPLEGFAALTKWTKIIELFADGDRVAMLYDCELPAPAGQVRIASFFRVVNGKIATYDTQFDAEGSRKLVGQKG